MAQIFLCGKLHDEAEIKASADKFHEMLSSKLHQIPKACPNSVKKVNLLQGQWGKEGCVVFWEYVFDGKPATSKEIMEVIDYKNKITVYKVIEGSPLVLYKTFKFILDVTPKDQGCLVRWTLEYEKLNENSPEPAPMLPAMIDMTKNIDGYLNQA